MALGRQVAQFLHSHVADGLDGPLGGRLGRWPGSRFGRRRSRPGVAKAAGQLHPEILDLVCDRGGTLTDRCIGEHVTQPATGLLPNLAEPVCEALQEICLCLSHVMPPFGTAYHPLLFIIGARIGYRQGTSSQTKGPSGAPAELLEIKRRIAVVHADRLTPGAGLIEGASSAGGRGGNWRAHRPMSRKSGSTMARAAPRTLGR